MNIVRATLNELDSLAKLFDLYRVFYLQKSDFHGARAFLKARLTNEESIIFIAYDEQAAVGFVQLYPSFSSVAMQRTWVLNDLYVKKDVRGKGFGEKLLKKAITHAAETGAKGLLLETGQDNTTAQRLYEKVGFTQESNYFYFFEVKGED